MSRVSIKIFEEPETTIGSSSKKQFLCERKYLLWSPSLEFSPGTFTAVFMEILSLSEQLFLGHSWSIVSEGHQ